MNSLPNLPMLYGTAWKEERTQGLTTAALRAGFRGIDTANQRRHYYEAAVGEAVKACVSSGFLKREDLFLQTKFTFVRSQDQRLPYDPEAPFATQVEQSFESSLTHLHTTYIDSLILHGPSTSDGLTAVDWEVWHAMERLCRGGRVRFLGVSNVNLEQLKSLVSGAEIRPRFVQNRCYARLGWDRKIRQLCTEQALTYQGFSLLTANAQELNQPLIHDLVGRVGRSLPEVVFRFAQRLGMIPLTGTSSEAHMKLDLASTDVPLTDRDVALIEAIAG